VYSYAVKSIVDLNPTEGAYLNALFWVSVRLVQSVVLLLLLCLYDMLYKRMLTKTYARQTLTSLN